MKLLTTDKEAMDRIIDRCSAAGSDNPNGAYFDHKKAEQQFNAFLALGIVNNTAYLIKVCNYYENKLDKIVRREAEYD